MKEIDRQYGGDLPGLLTLRLALCPETRGRMLEELEDDFREYDAADFTHQAPAGVAES